MAGPKEPSRKTFLLSGLAMAGLLLVGTVLVAVFYTGNSEPMGDLPENRVAAVEVVTGQEAGTPAAPVAERPSSLPRPGEGQAPKEAGDPGGWAQLLIFGLLAVAMLFIGSMIFVGGRKVQAKRATWVAAAAPGQEELRIQQHQDEVRALEAAAKAEMAKAKLANA